MALHENAAIPYLPETEEPASSGIRGGLAKAERELGLRKGVKGFGMGQTPGGAEAIVVYVEDQQTLALLPATVGDFPVIGVVTGEVHAL